MTKTTRNAASASLIAYMATVFIAIAAAGEGASIAKLNWKNVEKIIDSHPAFKSAKSGEDVAKGEADASAQYPNPQFEAALGQSKEDSSGAKSFIYDLAITIPLEWPGKYYFRNKSGRSIVEAAKEETRAARLEVYRELKSLYLEIAREDGNANNLQASEELLLRLAEAVKLRVDKGEARPMESAKIEGELEELRVEIEKAKSAAEAKKQELNAWFGGKLPPDFKVETDFDSLSLPPSADELEALAKKNNPELKAALLAIIKAEADIDAEKHSVVPDFGVGFFYGKEADAKNYGATLSLSLPLWNWNTGGISKAKAEKNKAQNRAELLEATIKARLINARAKAAAAFEAVKKFRETIIPKSEKITLDAEKLYQTGEASMMEVLDARRSLIRLKAALNETVFEFLQSELELYIITGGKYNE